MRNNTLASKVQIFFKVNVKNKEAVPLHSVPSLLG